MSLAQSSKLALFTPPAQLKSKAGWALGQVLKERGISQTAFAVAMGRSRSSINQWVCQVADPLAGSILDIVRGLDKLDSSEPQASQDFLHLFLRQSNPQPKGGQDTDG